MESGKIELPNERIVGGCMDVTGSRRAVEEGASYVAGGVNSSFRSRYRPKPLVFTSAHGCTLVVGRKRVN